MSVSMRFLWIAVLLVTNIGFAAAQPNATTGVMEVTPTGALRYTVPLRVPAGHNGLQPSISMIYDSRARGDSGVGWSIGGLSMITRCAKTMAQDGIVEDVKFLASDAYCLDGKRLIPINTVNAGDGVEYRTEIESFEKITSHGLKSLYGGPQGFSVQTKSGLTLSYGATSSYPIDALVLPYGSTTQYGSSIRGWALKTVRDQFGNLISYTYSNESAANAGKTSGPDDGVFYLKKIQYNQDKNKSDYATTITFSYVTANRMPVRYKSGYALPHSDKFLSGIDVRTTDAFGRSYVYNRLSNFMESGVSSISLPTRVASVKVCEGGSNCLLPLNFTYEDRNIPPFGPSIPVVGFPGTRADYESFFVDVNGDGKKFWFRISQAEDEGWVGSAAFDGTFGAERWTKFAQPVGSTGTFAHYFADIDGDGRADWIRISRATGEAWRALGTGNGGFEPWVKINVPIGSASTTNHYFADVNGDGRADWIQRGVALATGGGEFQFWTTTDSGPGGNSYFVDINGDGAADYISVTPDAFYTYISNRDGTFRFANTGGQFEPGSKVYFADLNGDGNVDALVVQPDLVVRRADGMGNGRFTELVALYTLTDEGINILADLDGDGMADHLFAPASGGKMRVYPSHGQPASGFAKIDIPFGNVNSKSYLADLNGDGKADLVIISDDTRQAWVVLSQAVFSGKMKSVAPGSFPGTEIRYKPISDNASYTADYNNLFFTLREPLSDGPIPSLYNQKTPMLVSSVISPNGVGGTLTSNYVYQGGQMDIAGRGILNMRSSIVSQVETGVSISDEFRMDWPYTGLKSITKKMVPGGGNNGLLSQTTYVYGCTNVASSGCSIAPGNRYFRYASSIKDENWDLNGAQLPTKTTSYLYDEFGNATQVLKAKSDGLIEQTDTVYNNDAQKWWIGRPATVTVTRKSQ